MKETPTFCPDCTCVPEGVTARVVNIRRLESTHQAHEYSVAFKKYKGKELGDVPRDVAILTVRADEVDPELAPNIEVGDRSELLVWAPNQSDDDIEVAIMACQGPKQPSRLERLVGKTALCVLEVIPDRK